MSAGRPTLYKTEYNKQVEKLCKLGSTDKELADFFEVHEDTINEWKKVHPEFSESIKKGKELADANVAEKLYQRALGFKTKDTDIKLYRGKVIKTELIKQYPPDSTAAIFWLKNRQPGKWRDRQEVVSKNVNINHNSVEMTHEEIKKISDQLENEV